MLDSYLLEHPRAGFQGEVECGIVSWKRQTDRCMGPGRSVDILKMFYWKLQLLGGWSGFSVLLHIGIITDRKYSTAPQKGKEI